MKFYVIDSSFCFQKLDIIDRKNNNETFVYKKKYFCRPEKIGNYKPKNKEQIIKTKKIMVVTLKDTTTVLQEIKKMKFGRKDALDSNLQNMGLLPDVIDAVCKELYYAGIIQHGYNGLGYKTLKITEFGDDYSSVISNFDAINQGIVAIRDNSQYAH